MQEYHHRFCISFRSGKRNTAIKMQDKGTGCAVLVEVEGRVSKIRNSEEEGREGKIRRLFDLASKANLPTLHMQSSGANFNKTFFLLQVTVHARW
jgi:hypothetical protein